MGHTTRKSAIDGNDCYFSKSVLKIYFDSYKTSNKLRANKVEQLIAQRTGVSESTVHGWLYGQTGPGDTDIIAEIAAFFGRPVSEFYEKEHTNMEKLNDQQIQAVDRIYKEIVSFLFLLLNTDGIFTGSNCIYGLHIPFEERLDYADTEYEKVRIAWYKEYVYLKDTQIYDELSAYIEDDLCGAYQDISDNIPGIDKCSPGYRYEGHPASEDFDEAMIKIQKLVCKYI